MMIFDVSLVSNYNVSHQREQTIILTAHFIHVNSLLLHQFSFRMTCIKFDKMIYDVYIWLIIYGFYKTPRDIRARYGTNDS